MCKEGANTDSRGVLATLRKGGSESTVGLMDTLDLLLKTLIPPDSIEGETEEHKRIREETGVEIGGSEETDWGEESESNHLEEFALEEVKKAIWRMGRDKAPGEDGITARILRVAYPVIAEIVTALFNECWRKARFPSGWKKAVVVPLLKNCDKDKSDPKSYRPISLLPVLSKALEYLICLRLREKIGPSMSENQYGFRANRSTTDAILRMREWTESRTEKYVLGVFLDISGAFDNAWWPAILHHMKRLGATSRICELTRNYLGGRYASITVPAGRNEIRLSKGCPQGSQFGPELWNILMDSLLSLDESEGELSIGYADDALLMVAGRTRAEVIRKTEDKLKRAGAWAGGMKLSFSNAKTKVMCLKGRLVPPYTVRMDGKRLAEVTEMDYLGVTLDDRWSFRNHVRRVAGKAAPMFQRIRRIVASTWGLSGRTTRRLYLGVFVPRMVYGAAVWGETVNDRMMKRLLLGAQRKALLAVTGAYRTTSTEALPVLAGVLPLDLVARQ